MSKLRKTLTIVMPIIAIICAIAGYLLEGSDAYYSLLTSFKFLGTSAPIDPSNVLIEIARWCGLFFAVNVLLTFFEAVLSRVSNDLEISRTIAREDSVAFHGDGLMAEYASERCGKRAVLSDDPRAFKCKTQVLLYSDDAKALEYYASHAAELEEAERIVINLDSTRADSLRGTKIYPLNLADTCAQQYWMKNPAVPGETIFLIGEGSYANSLITWGLLTNVFSRNSDISYYVVGDFGEYRMLHERLDETAELCSDKLTFLEGSWHDYPELIRKAGLCGKDGRVIVCLSPEESIHVGSSIVDAGMGKRVHMRAGSTSCGKLFGSQKNPDSLKEIILFGTNEELCDPDVILGESQYRSGKIVDLAYTCQSKVCDECPNHPEFRSLSKDADAETRTQEANYRLRNIDVNQCLSCKKFEDNWRGLSGFLRQSNYAVAVHDPYKVKLLKDNGIDVVGLGQQECVNAFNALPEDVQMELQEIEHIRWMRFHYLCNWHYSPTRNNQERLHPDLLPFDQLPKMEQIKDSDAYKFISMRVG